MQFTLTHGLFAALTLLMVISFVFAVADTRREWRRPSTVRNLLAPVWLCVLAGVFVWGTYARWRGIDAITLSAWLVDLGVIGAALAAQAYLHFKAKSRDSGGGSAGMRSHDGYDGYGLGTKRARSAWMRPA